MKQVKKRQGHGWRNFSYGSALKRIDAESDNLPGCTPDKDARGRPRPLDFEKFDAVDYALNDYGEEFN